MAEKLRNEVTINLAGEERTMRATFAAIRGVERDLKTNLVPLIEKMASGDIGVEQVAQIIDNGLRGYGDTRLSLAEVGDAIMEAGLPAVMGPAVEFVSKAMEGVSLGKPKGTKVVA